MAEQHWEYCRLWLDGAKLHEKFLGGVKGVGYNCYVDYADINGGKIHEQLTTYEQASDIDPFFMAMARLGGLGWEVISVQHRDRSVTQAAEGGLLWNDVVAYFKRPVQPGRKVNEPRLNMSM